MSSSSHIFSKLTPRSSFISALTFLSQFQAAEAQDKENSSTVPSFVILIVLLWIIICLPLLNEDDQEEARNRGIHQPNPIETKPILQQRDNTSYTTFQEEVSVSLSEESKEPTEITTSSAEDLTSAKHVAIISEETITRSSDQIAIPFEEDSITSSQENLSIIRP